jgi:hypothetical protein
MHGGSESRYPGPRSQPSLTVLGPGYFALRNSGMTSPLARGGGWSPDQEAALGEGDEPVDGEHEHGEDHHAGEHACGVEVALGLLDQE